MLPSRNGAPRHAPVAPDEAFAALAGALVRTRGVRETRRPATGLAFRGRIFAMTFDGALVVRLPPDDVDNLVQEGIGRAIDTTRTPRRGPPAIDRTARRQTTNEWATIRGSEDLWFALAHRAMEFASSMR